MSNKPIKIKVDVTKLDKSIFFHSEKTGSIYCDLVAWPSSNSQYGDTHTVSQQRPMDDQDRQMPIVGNMTVPDDQPQQPRQQSPAPSQEDDLDSIPF